MRFTVVIIVIVLVVVFYIKSIISSIKIKFDELANVAFSGFNLGSLNSNQTIITARVKLIVTLSSLFNLTISDLNIKASNNGTLIAESTPNFLENTKKINLVGDINNEIYQTFNFHFNAETLNLIAKIKAKQPYSINYVAKFKIFGIPVTKSATFNKL